MTGEGLRPWPRALTQAARLARPLAISRTASWRPAHDLTPDRVMIGAGRAKPWLVSVPPGR